MICSSWHTGPVTRSRNKRKNEYLDRVNQKSRVIKRITKKDSALVRHLAWLRELQESKKKLNEEKRFEQERKLEREESIRRNRNKNTKKLLLLASEKSPEEVPDVERDEVDIKAERPAWCRTENAQNETNDNAQSNDESALLEFIKQLNFDQYNEDLELQTLICQVKDRIKCLEKEKRKDEKILQACTDVSSS